MGTKNNPGEFDCYANAAPDEPMFVLLARDVNAPAAVEKWARERLELIAQQLKPESDLKKVREAMQCAEAMRSWFFTNKCRR